MRFIDKINPFKRGLNKQIDTSIAQGYGSYGFSTTSPAHAIEQLLQNCGVEWSEPAAKAWRKLSRILYNNIGLYERAIELHNILIGDVLIGGEISEQAQERGKQVLAKLPLLIEQRPFLPDTYSIEQYKKALVTDVLRDGVAFSESRFDEVGEYQGVMVFDSGNFDFVYGNWGHEIAYLDLQYPQRDEEGNIFDNPFFHMLKFEPERGQLWGVPLIRGGRLIAELFTVLLTTIMQQSKRFGNPMSMNFITQKDLTILRHGSEFANTYVNSIKNTKKQLENGLIAQGKGKGAELVATFPGDIDVISKTFGEKFTNFIDPETLWKVAVLFCNTLSIPPQFMGIRQGGSGIGSEEFSYTFKMLMPRIQSLRNTIAPVLLAEVKNALYADGMRPAEVERVQIEFSNLNIMSELERAEVAEKESRAELNRTQVYDFLMSVGQEGLAEQYAITHGLKE